MVFVTQEYFFETLDRKNEYTLHNVSMPISNPEVEAGDEKDGIYSRVLQAQSKGRSITGPNACNASQKSTVRTNRRHSNKAINIL